MFTTAFYYTASFCLSEGGVVMLMPSSNGTIVNSDSALLLVDLITPSLGVLICKVLICKVSELLHDLICSFSVTVRNSAHTVPSVTLY